MGLGTTQIDQKQRQYPDREVDWVTDRTNELHPSILSGGIFFMTAPICEIHLDLRLVRLPQLISYKENNF